MDLVKLRKEIYTAITGSKEMELTEYLERDVETLIQEVIHLSNFSPISRQSDCRIDIERKTFHVDSMIWTSKSLSQFMQGATQCVIMSATLGPRVDQKLKILQMTDMSKAFLFDLICMHYLEHMLDVWEEDLRKTLHENGQYLTQRFSPGYGDLPLNIQSEVLGFLDASKRIGIELTASHLMIPQKSVTAILGISTTQFGKSYSRCDACLKREQCKNRGGRYCEFS